MNEQSSGIFVARDGRGLFIRVKGRGTHQNAQPLRNAGLLAIREGARMICLDLAGCQGMDSTFLGVLAGFGLKLQELGQENALHLFNTSDRPLQSCQCLGLDRVAHLEAGPPGDSCQPPSATEFRYLPGSELTSQAKQAEHFDTAMLMLEAHEDLCRADSRNEAKFKEVKECLREEAERHADKKS